MPTPRLCGEVPGPYREHPLERAGDRGRGSELSETEWPPRHASARAGHASRRARPSLAGAARQRPYRPDPRRRHKLGWGGRPRPRRSSSARRRLDRIARAQPRRPHGDLRGRRAARPAPGRARGHGQMLALDPPLGAGAATGATIGGVFATGDAGPLRHRYGAPRDLILGITVALERRDGRPAPAAR